jgi:hypothetical protein
MYIGLIPEQPLFPSEHLTLVYMGKTPTDAMIEVGEMIVNLYNVRDRISARFETTVIGHAIMGSKHVQLLDAVAVEWRKLCEQCGLDKSGYPSWVPHISAKLRANMRPVGAVIRFPRAELRP